ncbi:uncharacterized protein LOC126749027 [Anthonomus grandis grandis]|uniref:uncharacterized protein LOC126749027 n=1 Tax=Anthonomus grandis grandis TaxID=2921223 RepID=UPI002166B62F|nr:uncharacterized protein LOC126749027 [Anthonomus grandis grandis]
MSKMAEQSLNIRLVQEVEEYPCLYEYTLNEYSRKDITEKSWNAIGKELNLSGTECKEKWKNLRAVFVRHMKPAPSGSSAKLKKAYYLTAAMQFALPYIKALNSATSGNLPKQSEEEVHDDHKEEESDDSQTTLSRTNSVSLLAPSPQSNSLQLPSPHSYALPSEPPQS